MYITRLDTIGVDEKIVLVGLGQENIQFLDWLLGVYKLDAKHILLADKNPIVTKSHPALKAFSRRKKQIFTGENYLNALKEDNIILVFKAPGIWSLLPEFVQFRKTHGHDSIHSPLVFFFEKFRSHIIAITGTKGKTSTSTMITHILNTTLTTAHYCGNTANISPYTFWKTQRQKPKEHVYFVIEVSSFQLQDLAFAQLSPQYGVITNYFIDHQDQHATPQEYWLAKDTLFRFQSAGDVCIVGDTVLRQTQSKHNMQTVLVVHESEVSSIMQDMSSPLVGQHNQHNAVQAMLICECIEANPTMPFTMNHLAHAIENHAKHYEQALKTYTTPPHRQENFFSFSTTVSIHLDHEDYHVPLTVRFYDDSSATEPDASIAALQTLSRDEHRFVWPIFCGKDKGSLLGKLAHEIIRLQRTSQLYQVGYCGEIGQHILQEVYKEFGLDLHVPFQPCKLYASETFLSRTTLVADFATWISHMCHELVHIDNRQKAIQLIGHPLELNIVLTPCGTSFDEFTNYKDRGEWFKSLIIGIGA
jgi:UDP-N-acetylmuramoylalanine-D-glutamate ligase